MGRNPHRNSISNPPFGPFPVKCLRLWLRVSRFVRSLDFWQTFSSPFIKRSTTFQWPWRQGEDQKSPPALPSGFQFDIPLLRAVGNAEQVDPDGTAVNHDEMPRTRPLNEPPAPTNRDKQSADLRLLALQIEQQKLEIKKLELEAQIKANTTSPLVKPETVHSLSTVRQSPNAGKSAGQFDYNVKIVAPQEWPHLHVPFGLANKKFKDLSLAEFVYDCLDIMRVASDEEQEVMSTPLMTLMRLAAKYKWLSVLSFHAAVLDRI